jgi:hypothetical protein
MSTVYRITATIERDGQALVGDQPEVLGESYGVLYETEEEAQGLADDYQHDADTDEDLGLRGVRYSVEAVEIDVGSVTEEWCGEDDDGEPLLSELDAYIAVDVTIAGRSYPVGVSIGIHESEQGSARASGCMEIYGGGPDAWWIDSSDWASLPDGTRDAVLSALISDAPRLWRETMAMRGEEAA